MIRVRYNGVTENHYDREIAITDDVSQELGFALIVIIALTTVIVIGVMAVTIILWAVYSTKKQAEIMPKRSTRQAERTDARNGTQHTSQVNFRDDMSNFDNI